MGTKEVEKENPHIGLVGGTRFEPNTRAVRPKEEEFKLYYDVGTRQESIDW